MSKKHEQLGFFDDVNADDEVSDNIEDSPDKVIILSDNGFIGDIVEYIRVTASTYGRTIEEQATIYKLTDEQCDRLGIPRRSSSQSNQSSFQYN